MSNMINRLKKRDVAPVKQVQLKLVRIDFWSAIRTGFTITIGMGIATIAGFIALWALVTYTPLFASLNGVLSSFTGGGSDITVSLPQILGVAFVLSVFNIVFGTLLTGFSALVYNIIARITGGIKVGFTSN